VCLAHQLRDCQYAIDAFDIIFAPGMKRLLLRAFIIHQRREKIDDTRLLRYRENLQERLTGILNLARARSGWYPVTKTLGWAD